MTAPYPDYALAALEASKTDPRWPRQWNTGPRPGTSFTRAPAGTFTAKDGVTYTGLIIEKLICFGKPILVDCVLSAQNGGNLEQHGSAAHPYFMFCEFDGHDLASQITMAGGSYIMRSCIWHDGMDGPRVTTGTAVIDSWCYHLHQQLRSEGFPNPLHADGMQVTGGTGWIIADNRIEAYDEERQTRGNSALQVGDNTNPLCAGVVHGNLVSGGSHPFNFAGGDGMSQVQVTDNVFVPGMWKPAEPPQEEYGPILAGKRGAQVFTNNTLWQPPPLEAKVSYK